MFLAISPWPPPPSAARSVRCSCTSIPAAAKPGQSPASRFTSAAVVGQSKSHGSCPCSPPSRWPASCRRRGWAPFRCCRRLAALGGALRGPVSRGRSLGGQPSSQAVQEQPEGRQGNRVGSRSDCPRWGRWGPALPGSSMASPLSVGIELQPPGVDQRWVRIWVLDAAARPLVPCRLVARSMAAFRARQLQAAYGAESLWWL